MSPWSLPLWVPPSPRKCLALARRRGPAGSAAPSSPRGRPRPAGPGSSGRGVVVRRSAGLRNSPRRSGPSGRRAARSGWGRTPSRSRWRRFPGRWPRRSCGSAPDRAPRPGRCCAGRCVAPTALLWPCTESMPNISGTCVPPWRCGGGGAEGLDRLDPRADRRAVGARPAAASCRRPGSSPEDRSSGRPGFTEPMSPWIIWPTFSSTCHAPPAGRRRGAVLGPRRRFIASARAA